MSEITRKLASVRRIEAIDPIEGADNIVCATVDGWKLVTQKSNNFTPGDLVVYFEIDSFLPVCERFEFLRKSSFKSTKNLGDGFRIKTIKLRGQVSQGLILPIDEFNELYILDGIKQKFFKMADDSEFAVKLREQNPDFIAMKLVLAEEGLDLTELLGVQKYEKPIPSQLQGRVRGNFPIFLPKTDQERIQNHFKTVQKMSSQIDTEYEATLKLDGSSMTAYVYDDKSGICSRNFDLDETDDNSFWQANRQYDLLNKIKSLGRNLAFQGELMGPGVQGNREGFTGLRFFVFDIYDIDARKYLPTSERREIVKQLDLEHAPYLGVVDIVGWSVDSFLADAERPSINHKIAEGVVYKNLKDPNFSFKCISNQFLLKEKD